MIDRHLKSNGEFIDLSLIKLLFAKTINDGLSFCRYLTRKHVDPTNFDRMNVTYARNQDGNGFSIAKYAWFEGNWFRKCRTAREFPWICLETVQLPRHLQPDSALSLEGSFEKAVFWLKQRMSISRIKKEKCYRMLLERNARSNHWFNILICKLYVMAPKSSQPSWIRNLSKPLLII